MRPRSRLLSAAGGKFGILLVALVALMASAPVVVEKPVWVVAFGLFAGAVLVASLHAARPGRRPVAIGLILALADFGIGRLVTFEGTRWLVILQILLWLSTLIFVTATILEAIFESEDVTVETLQASLCVYLLLGLIWVFAFALIEVAAPGSFQSQHGFRTAWSDDRSRRAEFMRLFVLSYSTLAGSGTGDLTPSTGFASMSVALEAMMGQIYLAMVLTRRVAIQAGQAPPDGSRGPSRRPGSSGPSVPGPGVHDSRSPRSKMSDRRDKIARAISSFVENPVTNLVKGTVLLLIGLSEASRTFIDDFTQRRLRVGHGLIIIGLFGILDTLPHFIEGLEAGKRYLDLRDKKARPGPGSGAGPDQGDDRAH